MSDQGDPPREVVLQTEAGVQCPFCGEHSLIGLDPGGGEAQDYVEDCPVCCRPWRVSLRYGLWSGEGPDRAFLKVLQVGFWLPTSPRTCS